MRNLKLGAKIALGFGVLIVIALFLGGLAVWQMRAVDQAVGKVDHELIPEAQMGAEVERAALRTMFDMRGYVYSTEKQFLEAGLKSLEGVKGHLAGAHKLPHWAEDRLMQEKVKTAQAKVAEYEGMVRQTVEMQNAIIHDRQAMQASGVKFAKQAEAFLAGQDKALEAEIKAGAEPAKLLERYHKISYMNEILEIGQMARVANWQAQALRDPKIATEALRRLGGVDQKLVELRAITQEAALLKEIEAVVVLTQAHLIAGTAFQETDQSASSAVETLRAASMEMIVGLAVALALGCLLAFLITRSITRPIQRVIAGLSEGSQQVAAAAGQVATSSQSLAEGASQQAAALEETSSSLEEMSSMTKTNADNAAQANSLMAESKALVAKADQSMGELTQSMQEISQAGEQTGKIIKTIDEIAFQTNLLALNAAVEAARAGEAGAGFAVVAEEVRNLAMRAAEAAKNTAGLIEGTIKKTQQGSELVARTNQAFQEVASSAEKVAELVGEIAAASGEQAQGIEQVNKAANEMDKVTQQNAANAEESASAAEELSSQAETMQGFVRDLADLAGAAGAQTRREEAPRGLPGRRRPRLDRPQEQPALPAPAARPRAPRAAAAAQRAKAEAQRPMPQDQDFRDF